MLAGALGALETGGLSLALVHAGAMEATAATIFMAGSIAVIADGVNRLQGEGFGEQ